MTKNTDNFSEDGMKELYELKKSLKQKNITEHKKKKDEKDKKNLKEPSNDLGDIENTNSHNSHFDLFRHSVSDAIPIIRDTHPRDIPQQPAPQKPAQATDFDRSLFFSWAPDMPQILSEQTISYYSNHNDKKIYQALKRGDISYCSKIDLHGMVLDEAYQALLSFIKQAIGKHNKSVLIVHGKSISHLTKYPILKNMVYQVLRNHPGVKAFHSAHLRHGGVGATQVLLKLHI